MNLTPEQKKFLEELEKQLASNEHTSVLAMRMRQQFPSLFHPNLYLYLRG